MSRGTIDYGIDLGTTNSAIAVIDGVEAKVIKNNHSLEITPSAVWINRKGQLHVGRAARERREHDEENTCVEFKLTMGKTGDPKKFTASGRAMGPEELSAEILKSLKGDVARRTGDDIGAAVITVPAAFELNACDATRRAAELAGLTQAPLLQEPIAAALAYGFQTDSDNVFWLVYDMGGGTFDAAIMQVRDGEFSVVNHRGDNFLGGKLIDWKIVDEFFIPAVVREHGLPDFARGNPAWRAPINRLKQIAEDAKIELSLTESVDLAVELPLGEPGRWLDFEYELRRDQVEAVAEPFITESINLCTQALAESGLGPGAIEKVLLVGGPTLAPYLRERLADPERGLGIPLDHSRDPVTVVAQGAAIFAGTQRLDAGAVPAPPASGEFAVELEYRPVGADVEPLVGGRVSGADGVDLAGFGVEFVNNEGQPPWRSGKIPLTADGVFTATLWADKGRRNTFTIELTDATGALRKTSPSSLNYTVGVEPAQPPLTHSIGVGLDDNTVEWLVERNTPLPVLRRRAVVRTTVAISAGDGRGMLLIPVLEGEHRRADRNQRIGRLEVKPHQVRRDVPEGSEVEFTIDIDESRLVIARAYVPVLDEEFEHTINLQSETVPTHDRLAMDAERARLRLEEVREKASDADDPEANAILRRISDEHMVGQIDAMIEAARVDADAAATCERRLRALQAALDEAEDALEWPLLLHRSEELISIARQIIEGDGHEGQLRTLGRHETAIQSAIQARDADLVQQRLSELAHLAMRVLDQSGHLPRLDFDELREMRSQMRDPSEAARLIAEGHRALDRDDMDRLRNVNSSLREQLPSPPPPPDPFGDISTVRSTR